MVDVSNLEVLPYSYTISMKPDEDKEFTELEISETGNRYYTSRGDEFINDWRKRILYYRKQFGVTGPKDISKPLITFGLRNSQDGQPDTWVRSPSKLIPNY